jgi:hypothetical protein
LQVPLMMPWIERMRLATRPSRRARMIGMPPATLASKRRWRRCLSGLEKLRAPLGEERLVGGDDVLAVLQRLLDQVEGVRGAADQFDDDIEAGIGDELAPIGRDEFSGTPTSRARSARRTATWSTRISVPIRCRSKSLCEARRRQTLAPTVPRPASPTRRMGVVVFTETRTLAEVF